MNKAMIAAAVLIWSAAGSAVAQGNPVIHLSVHDHPSTGSDGYTNVAACDATYSYEYSGGSGKGGDVTFTMRGPVTVVLKLDNATPSDRRYTLNNVTFENDTHEQLSWHGSAPTNGVIGNTNDVVQTASYKVLVNDNGTAGCIVPCDPLIINR